MKNYLLVNRALAAEKKINLIEMLQGCSKRNGTTFRQSNPDSRTTVSRQSTDGQGLGWYSVTTPNAPRFFARLAAMVTLLLTLACGNVWGADVTFNCYNSSTYWGTSSGTVTSKTAASDAYTVAFTKVGSNSNNSLSGSTVDAGYANLQIGNTINISAESTGFTKVVIIFTEKNRGPAKNTTWSDYFTANTGTLSKTSDTEFEWTGSSSTSLTLSNVNPGSGAIAFRVKTIVITPAGGGCGSTAQAVLTLSSSSGTICGTGTTTFTVSGGSGTGALSVSSSDASKATASIERTTVTVTGVAAGSATITVTKACDATYAEKTATYSATVAAVPSASAGKDKVTEPGEGVALAATAAADGCTGAWTIVSGPNTATSQLSSTTSATATFTPTVAGTYTLRWTVTNSTSGCSAYDDMTVTAAVCSISDCGNATLTYPIYTSGDLSKSNLFSSATSSNATAVSVGSSPVFTEGVTVSSATKGSSANAGACYAKSTALTGKMKYSASSKSSSYYIDFPFTVNTGYTFTPCDVQVVIQPVSSDQAFTVEITNGTNVYGTSTATLNAGVMEPIIGLTSPAEMSAGNYAIRLYPHGGDNKEFRMGANVILKGTTAAVASDAYDIHIGKNNDNYTDESLTNTSGTTWSKTITLDAGSYYEFKVKKTPTAGDAVWYGNNGKITGTISPAWDFNTSDGNCKLYTTVAGSYTFSWDASTNKLTITYPAGDHPTKRIYMACGSGTWCDATPKFFVHSWGVTDYNTQVQQNACGEYYADIIWYNDYFQFTRNNSTATAYDDQTWNYSQDLTYNSSQLLWTFSGWSGSTGNFSSSAYSPTTYTISYAAGSTTATGGAAISGSKAAETKTCGVDFTLPSSAVFTATGYTQVGWTTTDGGAQTHALGGTYTTNAAQTFYPVWEAAASLTALECNTLYKVEHMVPASITLTGEGQYGAGLSANTKFEVIGDPAEAGNAGGTPEMKNEAAEFASQSFTARMYLKGASNTTGSGTTFVPTSRAVKFIVGESGTLDIYAHRVDRLYLKKVGDSGTTQLGTSTSGSGSMVSHNVTAGTYYIYATGNSTCVYGVRLNCCTTPAAPTAFSAGSITSTGATFSITDAGDAASYDIYYSESSTAPTAGTAATTTSTEKTKAVTGLTASTTYYAWVRSVCDASHKSDWVALSGSSFTTTSTPAELTAIEANVLYQAADMANITFTGSDQWFAGLSTNAKFKTYGDGSSTSAKGKTVSSTSITDDIDTKNFTSIAYIMTADNTSSTSDPTKGAIEFITPSTAGTLYLYFENTSSALTLKKKGTSTSISLSGAKYKKVAVEANTHYFINGAGSNRGLYGIKFIADVTAPTFVSSVPANGATGVATSGTIVLTFSEPLGSVDASKFTLTGATKGTVTIDGSDAAKVNITYTGAANSATVTLATATAAVSDVAGNALAAALSNISFTTAAAPAGDCEELFAGSATSTSVFTTTVGSATTALSSGDSFSSGGYSYSVKPNSTNPIVASPKSGSSFAAGDSLIVVVYNNQSGAKTMGFKLGSGTYSTSVGSKKLHIFRQVLVASDISAGKVTFTRQSSDDRWVEIIIKHCGLLPSCTTPILPTLTAKTVCEGGDVDDAWNATITNSGSLVSGETVAYSWVKKGGSTPVSSVATYQPTDVTEAMAGTYVVTATVSADGKASKSASKEVELNVTEGTEVTAITADKATVYPTNSVTLTATANMDATWQWYTCTNAEGAGESSIGGATSASYTIASAPDAGTYYYKVKATGDCGTGSMVYTLTVSAAAGGDCETEFWFAKAADKPESVTAATHITGTPSGSSSATYTATIDGNSYPITGQTGQKTGNVTIVVPEDNEGTLYVVVQGSSSRTITLSKGGVQVGQYTPANSTWGTFTFSSLDEGTYTLVSSGNIGWGIIALKLCSGATCTDPEVTASVNNSTACVGTSVTFTATGAHASANYQWQKYSGGAWTDISGATNATYTIVSVATTDAMKYRVIASHVCDRTSNEVTLSVPVAPVFGSFTATRTVMATQALSITDVEASDATSYAWYKSADATYDAGTDTRVGTAQELLLASGGEAAGATYYLFCVASNACGSTTSSAITVNVTAFIEEDCATRGTEGAAEFGFQNSGCSQSTYNGTAVWSTGTSNSKILIYSAPDGKYFKTMKVTIASSSASQASYNWSTDGGTHYTSDGVAITGVTTTLTEKTINLSAHGNVNEVKIGRNFGNGESSGTLYVSKICFEYTSACTTTTVTPSTSSKTHTIGESFTKPTFTLGPAAVSSGTLTYSSSDEEIASVDESGNVTFNGTAGTVTITASYAGATIADVDYCASEGSYTITVSCEGGAPKIVADGSVNMSGCNSSVILNAKTQAGADFTGGSYQWLRNGEEIDGATNKSYTATQAGIYTVEYTSAGGCTSVSTNSAVVTSETTEPEVERLVPFQYYHVNKTYSDQMKMRHLFAVKNSGTLDGKHFKMYVSRNGAAATDVTSSNALVVVPNGDGHVDTVMVDLNKLSGKYAKGDELVYTCKAIDCESHVSETYKSTIQMHVIDTDTATLALICSGSNKASGTRKTSELTVGGDFLTGYNVADLCQQTGNTSFDANTEWGLYTRLKENYIVTPVNGYAVFNKLNYEPFDILLLTDYPKASKSDAAKDVLDDMAALCDYRPMLSFKTHMVAKSPSKWAAKGFTTSATENKADGRLNLNIVCYAHPMFESIKEGENVYDDVANSSAPLVYTMLTDVGHEGKKGMQGFELAAAENFVTIGLTHYNATITKNSPNAGEVSWTPGTEDRMLVTVAERQTNIEARFILFSLNCGAQSMLTEKGRTVILKCLEYLLETDPLKVADCSFTFDNGDGNKRTPEQQAINCSSCPPAGDGKWSNPANWGPDYRLLPGEFTSVRIKKPVEVDMEHAHVMEVRIIDEGSIDIPAGKALDVKSTIRRMDGTEIYPTEESDIHIGSASTGNGTLIFNNNDGDTKARVDMYSNAKADIANMSAATSTWQYIGTPHKDVASATRNYYDSWLYQYGSGTWEVIPNGGPLVPFRGYCVTHPDAPVVFSMEGTLAATTTQDIAIPAGYTVIANSWVAPIDINAITDDDMEGITDKTIYFFNTGTDAGGTAGTGTAAGTYRATPIHSSSYTGDWQIPSMQGFYVSTTSAGTLHLDYDRHVRPIGSRSVVSNPMYAPRRAAAESDEPNVLKIFARGSRYQDKLVVLEREDFTRGYDSGWDGEAWGGSNLSPMVYVTGEGREDAVSAIPEFEGTVIAFKAGEDNEYTIDFEYNSEEPLYLLDTENNTYTQIMTGNAYYFTTSDKSKHARFILTRKSPQIATGVGNVSGDEVQGTKAKKLLIEDKMFIMVNGVLYDATGKIVK